MGQNERYDKQQEMMTSIYRALNNSGVLLFAENLKATFLHQMLRKIFVKRNWRYLSFEEVLKLTDLFSETYYQTVGVLGVLGRNKWLSYTLSAVDKQFDCYFKDKDKYIISCVCKK